MNLAISDIIENKDKILKFTDNIETCEGLKQKSLKPSDEKLDLALNTWFIQQRSTGAQIFRSAFSGESKTFLFAVTCKFESADHKLKRQHINWLVRQIQKLAWHKEPSCMYICTH